MILEWYCVYSQKYILSGAAYTLLMIISFLYESNIDYLINMYNLRTF